MGQGESREEGERESRAIAEETKIEFVESMRNLYARRYLSQSERLVVKDAQSGNTVEPVRRAVRNRRGETCFETELYVVVIIRRPEEGTFLFPMDKATGEIAFPQSLVSAGETFYSTATKILETTCNEFKLELGGVLRFEFTPNLANTRATCIFEATYVGENEKYVASEERLYNLEWLTRKQVGNGRRRGSIRRLGSRVRRGTNPKTEAGGEVLFSNKIKEITKWAASGTNAFPVDMLPESGTANTMAVPVERSLTDMLKGNRYAYRVRMCCVVGSGQSAKVLTSAATGIPNKAMKISTSFENVAHDMLIDLCELCGCASKAELDGILFVEVAHSNMESSDEGHLTVTYYTSFPQDVLERKYKDGYRWITYKDALEEKNEEAPVFGRVAESKAIAPNHFLSSEKGSYIKALPLSVLDICQR